ncbi:hypothetical protein Xph01_40610 [Micromonospora phaseoli]|nr:hypothetical protein Xph01_40610 [Micromonospora phaseoli]
MLLVSVGFAMRARAGRYMQHTWWDDRKSDPDRVKVSDDFCRIFGNRRGCGHALLLPSVRSASVGAGRVGARSTCPGPGVLRAPAGQWLTTAQSRAGGPDRRGQAEDPPVSAQIVTCIVAYQNHRRR